MSARTTLETHIAVQPKGLLRRQFVAQLYQHVPAVFTVLAAGASAVRAEREGWALALAAAELVTGAWVLATIVGEARHLFARHAAHGDAAPHEEPWVDVPGLAAAAMGYVEVWHHAHERGHFKLVSPYMLSATAALFLAIGGRRLIRRRFRHRRPHLTVTPKEVTYRGGRRRRWTAAWADVAAVEHGAGELTLRLRDGSTRVLRADDHLGGGGLITAARAAVAAHAPAHLTGGVQERGGAVPLGRP